MTVKLDKWARIEGKVTWLDQPGEGEVISLTVHKEFKYPGMIETYPQVTADAEGNYVFPYVPPGFVMVNHRVKLPANTKLSPVAVRYDYPSFRLTLSAGESKRIDFGGDGMTVTGKLAGLDSYEGITLSIKPPMPETFSWFKMGMPGGGEDLMKGYRALADASYGPRYFRDKIPVASDGTFRIEQVMTGEYHLNVVGAAGSTKFTASSESENPIDLGTIDVIGVK